MSKLMLSVGLVLASLAGYSGAGHGATPEAKPLLTALAEAPVDGPYYSHADAVADANARAVEGYYTEIVYVAGDGWYVYCS